MSAYEFEEEREYESMTEIVTEVAYFVGHPEYLMTFAVIGYAS
jgi:hypothetical protein